MNGKKARALREMARRITVGAKETAYCARKNNPETILLAPDCTRSYYQRMKKSITAGIKKRGNAEPFINLNVKVKKMWKRKKNDEAEQMTMEPVQELDAVEEEKKRKEREQKLRENISRLYDNEKERADIEADITSVYADMKKEDLNKALLRKIFQLCSFKEGMRDLEVNFVYETYNKSIDLK